MLDSEVRRLIVGPAISTGRRQAVGPGPSSFMPIRIATDRCKGCELCVTACPKNVLALDPLAVNVLGYHPVRLIDATACTSCAFCARVCPDAVFTVFARPREA
jgi:2-oxoglutarate ferredoxin oxidoreductase subunit delta